MIDSFGRNITKLRLSVTDRCNLRCFYCMPKKPIRFLSKEKILSFDEMIEIVKIIAKKGINSIRITGGEPLMRKNICELIYRIANVEGIQDVSMTTNGILLAKYAKALKKAGLHRINVSLDTLNSERFREMTAGGELSEVLNGIEKAIEADLNPIKLNCVVRESSDEEDAKEIKAYAKAKKIKARFIRLMNLKTGDFSVVEGGEGGNCKICNRLRLLCDGTVKSCLFSDIGFNIREWGIEKALTLALENKPEMGGSCLTQWMNSIGG